MVVDGATWAMRVGPEIGTGAPYSGGGIDPYEEGFVTFFSSVVLPSGLWGLVLSALAIWVPIDMGRGRSWRALVWAVLGVAAAAIVSAVCFRTTGVAALVDIAGIAILFVATLPVRIVAFWRIGQASNR